MSFVRTYDSETARHGPLHYLLSVVGYPRVIWLNRYMIYNSFRRELMSRFHGSFLGAWWMLMQPLFLFCVYYFVFGILFAPRGGAGGPDPQFAVFLFSGIIVFHAMLEAIGKCVSVVTSNGNLVKKVAFPSETLVVPPAMLSIVLWAVGAVVCLVLGMSFGVLKPGLMLLTLPLVLLMQFAFTLGFGMLLANANVFIRDVTNLWRILSMAWFFLTPIFWLPDRLDGLADHGMAWAALLVRNANPAFPLVMCHRIAIGGTHPALGEFWPQFGVLSAWSIGMLVLGHATFVANKHKYADVV